MSMVPRVGCWTWELPQTLLGAMLYVVQRRRGRVYSMERTLDGRCLVETTGIGVSLGGFVYWSRKDAFGNPFDVRLIRAHGLGAGFRRIIRIRYSTSTRLRYSTRNCRGVSFCGNLRNHRGLRNRIRCFCVRSVCCQIFL